MVREKVKVVLSDEEMLDTSSIKEYLTIRTSMESNSWMNKQL